MQGGSELGCSGQSVCRHQQRGPLEWAGAALRPFGSCTRSPEGGGQRSCEGMVRDVSRTRECPSTVQPPMHRLRASEKNRFCKKTQKKRRCSCMLESLACPAAVLSTLLSLRDWVSLFCSTMAQHPSSELIRSMHF